MSGKITFTRVAQEIAVDPQSKFWDFHSPIDLQSDPCELMMVCQEEDLAGGKPLGTTYHEMLEERKQSHVRTGVKEGPIELVGEGTGKEGS